MESSRTNVTEARKCKSEHAMQIPRILDAKVEPLFSLPSDLMSPKRCKRKGEALIKEKEKVQKFRGASHTAKRLREEKFRRFMVGLIVKPELPEMDVDLSDDKDINRYYYYVCNGVDTIHTVSIEDVFVEAILDLVPGSLRDKFSNFASDLILEIKKDFTMNMKKAIVEFALTDPSEERPSEFNGIREDERRIQHPDLRKHVAQCREILHADLNLINPCMRMTLEQWVCDYSQFRLINLEHIVTHKESWDLTNFHTLISRQIVANRRILRKAWYIGIQEIFLVNNRKKMVPSPMQRRQFKRFFDCVAKLMESQLLRACKRSLRDFVNYIADDKPGGCRFKVSIIVVSRELAFQPSFDNFKKSLCNILEAICDAVRNFERLETQLYLDWAGPQEFLKPQISQPIVEQLKRQINQLIDRERIIPEQKMVELRKYAYLHNDEELGRTEAFLLNERTKLEEYEMRIKLYHDLAGSIPIEIERTVFAGFFEVSHAPFVRTIVENVERFKGLLIDRLVDRYQNTTKK
ncbi:dynein heavy chain 7, axonemal-like [Solenopsis invicta]|uniref:dynein heavy chain 7, axonemal-like n=1 Tax=Solenopsis invicta TaxID=13686 RepID=UPI000E33FE8E|nr:dynein heavy chain 7, axonemal-like [Solenopsis invicta]